MRAPCARFLRMELSFSFCSKITCVVSGVISGADWRSSIVRFIFRRMSRFSWAFLMANFCVIDLMWDSPKSHQEFKLGKSDCFWRHSPQKQVIMSLYASSWIYVYHANRSYPRWIAEGSWIFNEMAEWSYKEQGVILHEWIEDSMSGWRYKRSNLALKTPQTLEGLFRSQVNIDEVLLSMQKQAKLRWWTSHPYSMLKSKLKTSIYRFSHRRKTRVPRKNFG